VEDVRESRPGNRSWKRLHGKHGEDHFGAAFIQPGGSRYEQRKVADLKCRVCNKGGTAFGRETSLAMRNCKGFFCVQMDRRNCENSFLYCGIGKERKMGVFLISVKRFVKKYCDGEVTMPKLNIWMLGLICLLTGIVFGLLTAPATHGIVIGSNNGNRMVDCEDGKEEKKTKRAERKRK